MRACMLRAVGCAMCAVRCALLHVLGETPGEVPLQRKGIAPSLHAAPPFVLQCCTSTPSYLHPQPSPPPALLTRFLFPGTQTFSEELVRLPGCFLCYTPAIDAPPVSPLPAAANGFITFGSFNALAKITGEVLVVWARIMRRWGPSAERDFEGGWQP